MRKVKDNRQALPAFIASKSEIGAILAHLTALTSDHAARLRMQGPGRQCRNTSQPQGTTRDQQLRVWGGRICCLIADAPSAPTGFRPGGSGW